MVWPFFISQTFRNVKQKMKGLAMQKEQFIQELKSYQSEFIGHHSNEYMDEDFYIIHLASFGDYDSSCHIERSNHRWLRENYSDFISTKYEAYGTELAVIHVAALDSLDWSSDVIQGRADDLIRVLNALTDYPSIDDELASEVELEMQDEAWENVYKRDVIREIYRRFEEYEDKDFDESRLKELFEQRASALNVYWTVESGGNVYIDFRRIVTDFDEEDIKRIIE